MYAYENLHEMKKDRKTSHPILRKIKNSYSHYWYNTAMKQFEECHDYIAKVNLSKKINFNHWCAHRYKKIKANWYIKNILMIIYIAEAYFTEFGVYNFENKTDWELLTIFTSIVYIYNNLKLIVQQMID